MFGPRLCQNSVQVRLAVWPMIGYREPNRTGRNLTAFLSPGRLAMRLQVGTKFCRGSASVGEEWNPHAAGFAAAVTTAAERNPGEQGEERVQRPGSGSPARSRRRVRHRLLHR